ncbi:hypothetical protein QEN19_001195 [Hanseniaspora menglaensis]
MSKVRQTKKYAEKEGTDQPKPFSYNEKLDRKHINISDQIELISSRELDAERETDVEFAGSNSTEYNDVQYFIPTPKDETFYEYTLTHGQTVSTPGTVVSDFEYDQIDYEENIKNQEEAVKSFNERKHSKLPDIKVTQLQPETKNKILNETMLFMSLENKKIEKLNSINYDLELKLKILENLPKLIDLKNKMKIPPYLIAKINASSSRSPLKHNSFEFYKMSSDDSTKTVPLNRRSVSPMTFFDCEDGHDAKAKANLSTKDTIDFNKQPTSKAINKVVSLPYMRGSGIIGKDANGENIYKRVDGILIILKCKKCSKSDFISPQGILNHYRFKHTEITFHNLSLCVLENMEYYDRIQSNTVLNKFKELDLNPKLSYLPFNVAFTEPVELITETAQSLDKKVEFFKVLNLGTGNNVVNKDGNNNSSNNNNPDIKVGKNGKIVSGNFPNTSLGIKKNSSSEQSIQVISANDYLKSFLKDHKNDESIVDETNNFLLNYIPVRLSPDVQAGQPRSDETERSLKRRKLNNETQIMASLPDRKGKRKISIPKRLLED